MSVKMAQHPMAALLLRDVCQVVSATARYAFAPSEPFH